MGKPHNVKKYVFTVAGATWDTPFTGITSEKVGIELQTSADYNGTTATMTFQVSNSNVNFADALDDAGNTLVSTLAAADTTYLMTTTIFCYYYYNLAFAAGDATTGTVEVYVFSQD